MAELLEGIGHNIRRLREEKEWNQTELGFHADTSPSIISLIENGKRNPSTATLAKIAGALGVEVVELFPKASGRSSAQPTLLSELESERPTRTLEWLPGYLLFLKQQTESMRTRWEAAIEENTVEPGAWHEAAEVEMDLGKSFMDTIPPPLYATEDRGPLREEWGETVDHALGSLRMLRRTLDKAYHAGKSQSGEKGNPDHERDELARRREQRRPRREEAPEPRKATGAGEAS